MSNAVKEPRRHFEAENYLGLLDAEVVMSPAEGRLPGLPFDFMEKDFDASAAAKRICEHFASSWAINYEEGRRLICLEQPVIIYKDGPQDPWIYRLRGRWAHPEDIMPELPRLRFMECLGDAATQAYARIGEHP